MVDKDDKKRKTASSSKPPGTMNTMIVSKWKSMGAAEKQFYEKKAMHDRLRYIKDYLRYVPSPGFVKEPLRVKPPEGYNLRNGILEKTPELGTQRKLNDDNNLIWSYLQKLCPKASDLDLHGVIERMSHD